MLQSGRQPRTPCMSGQQRWYLQQGRMSGPLMSTTWPKLCGWSSAPPSESRPTQVHSAVFPSAPGHHPLAVVLSENKAHWLSHRASKRCALMSNQGAKMLAVTMLVTGVVCTGPGWPSQVVLRTQLWTSWCGRSGLHLTTPHSSSRWELRPAALRISACPLLLDS